MYDDDDNVKMPSDSYSNILEGIDLPSDEEIARETKNAKISMNSKSAILAKDPKWIKRNAEKNRKMTQGSKWKQAQKEGIQKKLKDTAWLEEHKKRTKKLSLNRSEKIKNRLGAVITPIGEFDCVKHAWQAHCEQDPNTVKNPHNWFKKMCKDYPNDYYKKSPNQGLFVYMD